MNIKCVRCGKEINNANSKNAKYIINNDDVKTHGPRKFPLFNLKKGLDLIHSSKKEEEIATKYQEENVKIKDEIKKDKEALSKLRQDLKKIDDIPENKEIIDAKKLEIEEENDKYILKSMNTDPLNIEMLEVEESVPKTAIICRDEACQNDNDTIIWG
jgi:hypothetical protein